MKIFRGLSCVFTHRWKIWDLLLSRVHTAARTRPAGVEQRTQYSFEQPARAIGAHLEGPIADAPRAVHQPAGCDEAPRERTDPFAAEPEGRGDTGMAGAGAAGKQVRRSFARRPGRHTQDDPGQQGMRLGALKLWRPLTELMLAIGNDGIDR